MKSEMRNITLVLPRELVRRLKVVAAERDTSISALLRELLEGLVAREDDYDRVWEREIEVMERGLSMGTGGRITWTRDEVHER